MPTTLALETRALTKHYGRVAAVEGLSLSVERGQIFGFLGPNGAGKSTTLRMLLGLIRPTRGSAWLLGRPCSSVAARAPGQVGALVEDPAFYGYLTARQNLTLLSRLTGGVGPAEIDAALAATGLSAVGDRKVSAFSHGMRQRLGVAQALVPRPQVLILDEPTNGLDPRGRVEMRDLLRRLNADHGVTVVLSSHLLAEIEQLCTHLAFVSHGRLLTAGPTAELLAATAVQVELLAQPVAEAFLVLSRSPAVAGLRRQGEQLLFTTGRGEIPALNAALVRAGVAVFSLAPHSETLEDLYLRLTEEAPTGATSA
ncbi:MAG TPA: ABC transporter ATP-binding protein [Armatimonadota bacterium]|jgi:ABC-2 type transport system ATP-binding protein